MHPCFPRLPLAAALLALLATGCAVGPTYQRPAIDTPAAFKEGQGEWVKAVPADTLERGPWWELFNDAERSRGLSPYDAVREACLLRFRPILMTTMAAILGALPLAIGFGEGAELRRPLGIAIIGGLVASQVITLLTTPVVYLLMDKLRRRSPLERQLSRHGEPLPTP